MLEPKSDNDSYCAVLRATVAKDTPWTEQELARLTDETTLVISGYSYGFTIEPGRDEARDRSADKERILTDRQAEVACEVIDEWADIARRKDDEASAAYLLLNERTGELEAMTRARDHCKKQANDAMAREQTIRHWLRLEHPEVYASLEGGLERHLPAMKQAMRR